MNKYGFCRTYGEGRRKCMEWITNYLAANPNILVDRNIGIQIRRKLPTYCPLPTQKKCKRLVTGDRRWKREFPESYCPLKTATAYLKKVQVQPSNTKEG